MKKGILIKEGKYWKIQSDLFKQPMSISGDFGLKDEMANKEVEFDNSKGPISVVKYNGQVYKRNEYIDTNSNNSQFSREINNGITPIGKASAPYNFIPINDIVVKSQFLGKTEDLKFNSYDNKLLNGRIVLKIQNRTPIFIRGNRLLHSQLKQNVNFFSGKKICIPGSSMRGLLRTMVEIISYSRMSSINESTRNKRFHYRAFADKSLSLRNSYNKKMLCECSNPKCYYPKIEAGVLKKNGRNYQIFKGNHYRVEEDLAINSGIISQPMSINYKGKYKQNNKYKQEYKQVFFVSEEEKIHNHTKPLKYSKITSISNVQTKSSKNGYLICSGWMIGPKSTRGKHMHWVVGDVNYNQPLEINKDIINNYNNDSNRKGLDLISELQKQTVNEVPCFFIRDNEDNVISFGATAMFRLAYDKALIDFFPEEHNKTEFPDFACALFGDKNFSPGRIFIEDCYLNEGTVSKQIKIPSILGTPKPTTFQHYLKQNEEDINSVYDNNGGFNGIKDYNQKARVSGFKLFWHQKVIENPDKIFVKSDTFDKYLKERNQIHLFNNLEFSNNKYMIKINELSSEQLKTLADYNLSQSDSQYTAIVPILENAHFEGVLRFENLSEEELGSLLFILDSENNLCFKIGMGKPLGYGSIKIEPDVYLSNRKERYENLFYEWGKDQLKLSRDEINGLKSSFEKYILTKIGSPNKSLWDEQRLKELRIMLDFNNRVEGEKAKYMELRDFASRSILQPPSEYIKNL